MIHQGQDIIPVEFIVLRQAGRDLIEQHPRLVANALAQAQALMLGAIAPAATATLVATGPARCCCWNS